MNLGNEACMVIDCFSVRTTTRCSSFFVLNPILSDLALFDVFVNNTNLTCLSFLYNISIEVSQKIKLPVVC